MIRSMQMQGLRQACRTVHSVKTRRGAWPSTAYITNTRATTLGPSHDQPQSKAYNWGPSSYHIFSTSTSSLKASFHTDSAEYNTTQPTSPPPANFGVGSEFGHFNARKDDKVGRNGRYSIIEKTGCDMEASFWSAWDTTEQTIVTLRILTSSHTSLYTVSRLEQLASVLFSSIEASRARVFHPDSRFPLHDDFGTSGVARTLDMFTVPGVNVGPNGKGEEHLAFSLRMIGDSLAVFEDKKTLKGLGKPGDGEGPHKLWEVKIIIKQLLHALQFLHEECKLIHGDIRMESVHIALQEMMVKMLQTVPEGRKLLRRTVPGAPNDSNVEQGDEKDGGQSLPTRNDTMRITLTNFGSALPLDQENYYITQAYECRAPEVTVRCKIDEKVDIWAVGCLLLRLLTSENPFVDSTPLFQGPEDEAYLAKFPRGLTQLAYIKGILSDQQYDLDEYMKGKDARWFFMRDDRHQGLIIQSEPEKGASSLREMLMTDSLIRLEGKDLEGCLDLVGKMLRLNPRERRGAAELVDHWWLGEK